MEIFHVPPYVHDLSLSLPRLPLKWIMFSAFLKISTQLPLVQRDLHARENGWRRTVDVSCDRGSVRGIEKPNGIKKYLGGESAREKKSLTRRYFIDSDERIMAMTLHDPSRQRNNAANGKRGPSIKENARRRENGTWTAAPRHRYYRDKENSSVTSLLFLSAITSRMRRDKFLYRDRVVADELIRTGRTVVTELERWNAGRKKVTCPC